MNHRSKVVERGDRVQPEALEELLDEHKAAALNADGKCLKHTGESAFKLLEQQQRERTWTRKPINSNSTSPYDASATPNEMSETMRRILRVSSFSPNDAETRRTETGVKALII